MATIDYTNISDIKDFWIKNIAPMYFDMQDTNNYQVGIFGYINEIMAESLEDTHQAIHVARREFYPSTAQYMSSINKMAALQLINPPMATPSEGKAILILDEREILSGATYENGMYKFVLDNTMIINAGTLQFSIDYPIIILAKKNGDGYSYTCHYDINRKNSLVDSDEKYIPNKVVHQNGVKYLLINVRIRQCVITSQRKIVMKEADIATITLDFVYDGTLANFEVYYQESETSQELQLEKVPVNGTLKAVPFCYYEFIGDNIIRISFIKNAYFMPVLNSTIRLEVYTTEGSKGNIKQFDGDLECTMHSTDYPYNNTMVIVGKLNGSATKGKDKPTDEEYIEEVKNAYITNKTHTSYTDIQTHFNSITHEIDTDGVSKTKVLFRKKRDDALIRLFGAYVLMRDAYEMIIPTNTLKLMIHSTKLVDLDDKKNRIPIKPGQIFVYSGNDFGTVTDAKGNIYQNERNFECTTIDAMITDDVAALEAQYGSVFVNPFLIMVTVNPNMVGFYLNSINVNRSLQYNYVNDKSYMQFIASSLSVYRNAILGDNYYTFKFVIMSASDLDPAEVIDIVDETDETNLIRATQNGVYKSCKMTDGRVIATIEYEDGSTQTINVNSYTSAKNDFVVDDGYKMQISVGDSFIAGNILAIKKPHDKGKIRIMGDFENKLINNKYYIPMYIEEYDEDINAYHVVTYIATDDTITLDANILITDGIYQSDGVPEDNVTIPMQDLTFAAHVFYHDDNTNYNHTMAAYKYVSNHTLTNSYSTGTDTSDHINLITAIDYIRSTLDYTPGENAATDVNDYYFTIDEAPVLKASWAKSISNYDAFVDKMLKLYSSLQDTFSLLENNFNLDMKFYNTYGKARFYQVGLKDERQPLDVINCKVKVGVFLKSIGNSNAVLAKIRSYIKEYVEEINFSSSTSQSIYILRMIADCTADIAEIDHMEYYGFNSYDHGIQSIEGLSDLEISENGIVNYIPEFININPIPQVDGTTTPDIEIILLNEESA